MYVEGDIDRRWIGAVIHIYHWHFHRRLFERYHVILPPGEFTYIVNTIASGEAMLIEPRANGAGIYSIRLPISQKRVYVLAKRRRLITVWPRQKRLENIFRQLKGPAESSRTGKSTEMITEADILANKELVARINASASEPTTVQTADDFLE